MQPSALRFLLHGIDTIQCCYYLRKTPSSAFSFEELLAQREQLRLDQAKDPEPVMVGGVEFMLAANGSRSGYPLVLSNRDCRIECGEHTQPSFFVTYRSEALWYIPAAMLHDRFISWAQCLGLLPVRRESLSRVDFAFDYYLPEIDFDEDCFLSLATKDAQHRQDGLVQTFTFGRSDVVLRVYDKVAEITQQSGKGWLFDLWGEISNVWRIEWQVRKDTLRRFGIRTVDSLYQNYGHLLRYLVTEHDTLRVKSSDTNRSRWPVHELWVDLRAQIEELNGLGIYREERRYPPYEEQKVRLAIQVYGYLKRFAALETITTGSAIPKPREVLATLGPLCDALHDPFAWRIDVKRRIKQAELGQWSY